MRAVGWTILAALSGLLGTSALAQPGEATPPTDGVGETAPLRGSELPDDQAGDGAPAEGSAIGSIAVDAPAETPTVAEGKSETRQGIEEIIVTAQKREENLQDVPITIAAFTGDQLEKSGVQTLNDLAFKTPGLVFDTQINYAIIFIRGVGTDAFVPSADMSVAPYVDGVYFPNSFGLARAIGEVERVEVLKGPQGTLFGRNATGGAINVVTKKPSRVFSMSADTSYGTDNETNNRLSISGPITDTLSGTLSLLYNHKDEYYEFVEPSYPRSQPQSSIDRGGRLKLLWEPSERLDFTLNGFHFGSQGLGTSLMPCLEPTGLGVPLGVTCETGRKTNVNSFQANRTELDLVSLTAGFHPGSLDLKSISAYQESNTQAWLDFDGSSANVATFTALPPGLVNYTFTQELQLLSNDDSFGADYLKWVAGLYYIHSKLGYDAIHAGLVGTENGLAGISTGQLAGTELLGLLAPLLPGAEFTSYDLKVTGFLDTDAYAGFTQFTVTPVEWLEVTLGGRYQHEKRTVFNSKLQQRLTVLGQTRDLDTLVYEDRTRKENRFSPKATISVKPSDESMVYASWQRAYKSGSFNILNITKPPTDIRPETVTTTEVGAKTRLFDGVVQLNMAVFDNHIKDLQSQFLSLLSGGVTQFQNAPKAHTKGIDADFQWAAADGLRISTGITYLRSKYDEFPNAQGYDENGYFASNIDNTGNKIVRNPKWTIALGLDYSVPLWRGVGEFGADYYSNSGYWFDAQNTLEQPSYSLLNLRVGYLYEPWMLRVSLTSGNATAADYYLFKYQQDFAKAGKLAPGREYALRLHWDFGN